MDPSSTTYLERVRASRDYSTVECFDYLAAMFPGFQSSGIYRADALEEHRGSLSWGAALVTRSYLKIYEMTGDEKYLRAFVGVGEQLLLARDSTRGAADYLGRSGPVWRSGRPYTTNLISFSCSDGGPCLEIRSKQATHIRIDNPSPENATFDIEFLAGPNGASLASFPGVGLQLGHENCLQNVLVDQQWKAPQAAAVLSHDGCMMCLPPAGVYELREQYYAPAIHVSQICVALLEFSRIIVGNALLERNYAAYAKKYVQAATEALKVYEPDYRVYDGAGYYVIPEDAPHDFDGTDAPQNHNMSMALCFLLLYEISSEENHKLRASELLRTFRSSLMERNCGEGVSLVWSYFVPSLANYQGHSGGGVSRWRSGRKGNRRMEDMSHGVLAVEAAVKAHQLGIEITAAELEGMANAFLSASRTGSLSNYLDGSAGYGKYDTIAGRWAILAPWDERVYARSLSILQMEQPQPVHASVLLSCANVVREEL